MSLIKGRPVISLYQSFSPELRTPMNVREFPFDSQELEMKISGSWLISDVNFVYNGDPTDSAKLVEDCVDPIVTLNNEFDLTGVVIEHEEHRYENLTHYDFQDEGYHEIVAKFQMTRNPTYFLRGIFLVINLVVLIGATCFWLDQTDTGTRFSISTTMFLTLVAFHFVTLDSLPKVSYSTRLDKWMSACYSLIFLSNVENILMFNLSKAYPDFCTDNCDTIDRCLFGGYTFLQLVFGLWFVSPLISRRKAIKKALKNRKISNKKQSKMD